MAPPVRLILDSHPHLGWGNVELSYSPGITGAGLEVSVEQADLEPRDHLPLASALGLKAVPQHLTNLTVLMTACCVTECLSTATGISAFSRYLCRVRPFKLLILQPQQMCPPHPAWLPGLISICLYWSVHVGACTCMRVQVWSVCRKAKVNSVSFLSCFPPYLLRQGLLLNLELVSSPRLAEQLAPEVLLLPSPQHWDCRCVAPGWFILVLGVDLDPWICQLT